MHINVNFIYEAEVKHRRKVNAVTKSFVGTVPVEVAEAAGSDAPVAMRFRAPLGYDPAPGFRLEVRTYGDALYVPYHMPPQARFEARQEDHPPRGAAWLRETAEGAFRSGHHEARLPFRTGTSYESLGAIVPIADEPGLREVVASKEAARAAEIRADAADLLVVDGILHRRCPEPYYRIQFVEGDRRTGEGGYAYLSPEFGFLGPDGQRQRMRDREYRADEEGYATGRRYSLRLSDEDRIEVLVPEAVREDIPQRQLLETAQRVNAWMRDRVANRDVPFFRAFYDLRESMERDGLPVARGDCALPGDAGAEAHAALARIADALNATLSQVSEIDDGVRRELETRLDRIAALGLWQQVDAAHLPVR
jgi:hypothetical protein